MTAPANETPPVVLAYDGHTAAKDPRARWIIPGYCAGLILAGIAYALVEYFSIGRNMPTNLSRWINAVLLPIAFAIVSCLPSAMALGLAMWTKQKIAKEVRYSRFRATVIWGFAGGLYPEALCQQIPQTEEWMGYIFLGWLIWHAIFPTVAAMFLCYRSHLRD